MKNISRLKKEINSTTPKGVWANYYYKYLGYKNDFLASPLQARVNAICALFTKSCPHVYKNDLIVGSILPMWKSCDQKQLDYAKTVCENFGERGFLQNYDHFAPDYKKLVNVGVCGLFEEIRIFKTQYANNTKKIQYLNALEQSLNAFKTLVLNYANKAEQLKSNPEYSSETLDFIVENLKQIANGKPQTFAQSLQLVWLWHVAFLYEGRFAMALGRIDQYLYPFYKKDIESGILKKEFAIQLLQNAFLKIYERRQFKDIDDTVNICIGGTNCNGESEINDLSFAVLQAVKNCNVPGPNLSARIPEKVSDDFLDQCLKVIGTGLGYPALMNDKINILALEKIGYDKQDVYDYSMVGCIENFITGKQPPWSDGRFDTPRFFEYMFNDGYGIIHPSVGVKTANLENICSMQEFLSEFETQLEHGAKEYFAFFNNENTKFSSERFAQPFISLLCDNCIANATDIMAGGSKYPSVHGVGLMGIATVCDSLSAIEKVVFEDKKATLSQLATAIKNNYVGYEWLQKLLLDAPKYGNNDKFVDKYAVWFVDYLSSVFSKFKTFDGGSFYVGIAANINNITAGKILAATPDGRLAHEPLSDAASPTYGKDVKGSTCVINSVTKPDYTKVACGTVVNQKFSPEMFKGEKRKKLLALIKTYFKKGGQEIQINATSREVLIDAMNNPQKHKNLVVRVSGFSAFFISLDKDVQIDILNRTQQE